jgi:predicted SAM-dependent methyltransferase
MIIEPEQKKLNMGCGFRKLDGFWNVDVERRCNPDQVVDLEKTPWEWEDNFFEDIMADNVLEHLGHDPKVFSKVIQEMYRVSCPGARWVVMLPHHRCDLYWNDYTHVRVLTPETFRMFDQEENVKWIQAKRRDSVFGLYHNVDIEVTGVRYKFVDYWENQLQDGMMGPKQFDINFNTMNNVAESLVVTIKVHKPQRHKNFLLA